ncbi:hypothetical protein P5V15_001168 [Pogonomyrmex californicus]
MCPLTYHQRILKEKKLHAYHYTRATFATRKLSSEKEILRQFPEKKRLNSVSYLEFLSENLPDFLEEIPLLNRNKIIFQQDGAGPHNARIVTDFLNQQFPVQLCKIGIRFRNHFLV